MTNPKSQNRQGEAKVADRAVRVLASGWLAPDVAVVQVAPAGAKVQAAVSRAYKSEPRRDVIDAAFEACDFQLMLAVHESRAARRG